MPGRVLHLLSQQPGFTGSGFILDAIVRQAGLAGWDQQVVVGLPGDADSTLVGGLPPTAVFPLRFDGAGLDFPVPGMSDVMPYASTRFAAMTSSQLTSYRTAWSAHVTAQIAEFRPHLIHCHHVWILSSLIKKLSPATPTLCSCHATGLRQMKLCPHLAPEVKAGCARLDRFTALHEDQRSELAALLELAPQRVHLMRAGYRETCFHPRGRKAMVGERLLYAGKLSRAKGLPSLLDACEILRKGRPGLELHVAGSGAGAESEALLARMAAAGDWITLHGQVDPPRLGELMRQADVFVLPSFYEGVPLVLVEAAACGCELVATALPGVRVELAPRLGACLRLVEPPLLRTVDEAEPASLPHFIARLAAVLDEVLSSERARDRALAPELSAFGWKTVFEQLEGIWLELRQGQGRLGSL